VPFEEIEGAKRALLVAEDHLRLTLKEEREGAAGAANVDRLPQAIQHQDLLIEVDTHALAIKTARKLAHAEIQCQTLADASGAGFQVFSGS
jgi:hypothetical protein